MTNDPQEMLAAYVEGKLNAQQVAELEAWLREDPDRCRAWVRQAMLDCHLTELLQEQNLRHINAQATAEEAQPLPIHIDAEALTREKYISALSYVLSHTFTPKRIAAFSAAAVVLLGLLLAIVLMDGPETPQQIVETPSQPTEPTEPEPEALALTSIVATLTAERQAIWDRRPGQDLYAGQRFTLLQGIAEVTTGQGAVVMLQAPARIELLDNDNALRLLTGRLVGTCETPTSKGFVVHTPHMVVTDLGTRFGIDATEPDSTQVHVFQGSVAVSSPRSSSDPAPEDEQVLTSGHAVRADEDSSAIRRIQYTTKTFEAIGPSAITLAGTGAGLTADDIDPNWQIVTINGQPLDTPQALPVFEQPSIYSQEHPNDPATSQWLAWLPPREQQTINSTYVFRSQINLPEHFEPKTSQLVGRFMADHKVTAIRINGQDAPVPAQQPEGTGWHTNAYEIVLRDELLAGQNIIEFDVLNDVQGLQNFVGLRVAWELQTEAKDQY